MTRSLREQARDMDSTRPDPTMFGLYSMRIEGRTLQIQQQALDDLRRQFRTAILTGIRPIEVRIADGRSRHESMNKIRSDQFIVSRVSDVLGGVDWPSMSIWGLPEQWMKLAQACLRENMYEKAVIALEYAERTSAQASRTLHEAIEGTISGAGRAVTTLEITRDVSIATAGILATVATGGTAGILISTGIGTTATVAQQGMEVHLGLRDRIDWEGITIQTAVGLVTSKFGGQLGNKITARLVGNPAFASVSRRVVSELVGDLTAGKTSAALQMAVTNLYNTARGRPDAMNMDQFLDALAAQLTDPRSTFMDMAMGRVARRAAAGAPAQTRKQKPPAQKQQQQTPPQPTPAAETSIPKVPPPVRPKPKRAETRLVDSAGRPLSPRPTRPQLVDAQGQPIRRPAPKRGETGLVDSAGRPLSPRPTRPQLVDAQGQPIRRPMPKRGETGLVDPTGHPISSQRPTQSGGKQQHQTPPKPAAAKPKVETIEEFKARGGQIKKIPAQPTPKPKITAQPKKKPDMTREALGEGPGTGAVHPANKRRAGMAAKPKHHVFPQDLERKEQFFTKRGFTGSKGRSIHDFVVELDEAHHGAIHGGGDYQLARKEWSKEWNQRVKSEVQAEEAKIGRLLNFDETKAVVEKLMVEYKIPLGKYVKYKPRKRR